MGPSTGTLGSFGEGDAFVLAHMRKALEPGIVIQGKRHPVRIIERDSESSASRAARSRGRILIKKEKVDLMLAASVTTTVNPVSRSMREKRRAVHHDGLPVAIVLFRPRRRSAARLRLDVPLLLGTGRCGRRLHEHVEQHRDQQSRGSAVAARTRTGCVFRSGHGFPKATGKLEDSRWSMAGDFIRHEPDYLRVRSASSRKRKSKS